MSYDLKDASAVTSGVTDDAQFFGALAESSPLPAPITGLALWQYVNGKMVGTYPTFYPTIGIPDNDVGVDGSVAIDYAAGLSYVKAAGTWGGATAMRLRPRGAYSGATAYLVGDVATNQSASWVNIAASTGVAPPTLPTETNANWALIAKSGELTRSGAQTGGIAKFISDTQVSQLSEISVVGGNVGIGTTAPTGKLQVAGDLGASGNPTTGLYSQLEVTGATDPTYRLSIGYNTASDYGIIQALRNGFAFKNLTLNPSGGNVGVGTSSPGVKLDVESTIGRVLDLNSTHATGPSMVLQKSGSDRIYFGEGESFGLSAGYADLYSVAGMGLRFSANASEVMRVLTNGNVGIGTSSPGQKFFVSGGNIGLDDIQYLYAGGVRVAGAAGGNSILGSVNSTFLYAGNAAQMYLGPGSGVGIGLIYGNGSVTPPTNGLVVQGNVGIGTTSPSVALDVNGPIRNRSAYTVATLPAASLGDGIEAYVSDASVAANGNLGTTVSGGGANSVKVRSKASTWIIAGA